MSRDDTTHEEPTRRDYMKYGGAVVGGGLLAGCVSGDSGSDEQTNELSAGDDAEEEPAASAEASYSVSMSPMGAVEFDGIPQSIMAGSANYIDIVAALGHGAAVESSSSTSVVTPSLEYFYSKLDVPVDWIDFRDISGFGKEILYELDSDVHITDPCYLASTDGWDESDVDEISENVAPFFGNMYSRKHRQPPEGCRDSYQYYTIEELTEKYADVFGERDRFEQLNELRTSLLEEIQSGLPDSDSRPRVGMVYPRIAENAFYVHQLNQPGYFFGHTRPLAATNVFSDIDVDEFGGALVDYETMVETNPDIIIMNHGISAYYNVPETKEAIRNHNVASTLTAVQNDRLYVSGNPRQGPVMNLFQIEMTAKQFYPEQFGEWPGYEDGEPYPEIPDDEQLFDRQRVSDIVNGEI